MSPTIEVLESGLLTTVQDLGRPGFMGIGVTPGGALDRTALVLGNRLLANDPGAAALEITLLGPRLRFRTAAVVVLAGADLGAERNGAAAPRWRPFRVAAGDALTFAGSPPPDGGARVYLCIAGGIDVEPVMGSRGTDLFAGFGGWRGRALRAGDAIPVGAPALSDDALLRRRLTGTSPKIDPERPIRVVLGPQEDRFTAEGRATFLDSLYQVTARSDRMGLRLAGPAVAHVSGADLVSEGIAHGAVQVPGDGQPIVLLAGRQTVGGYPKIATAIAADLDLLGQRRPSAPVRFVRVDVTEARTLAVAYHAALGEGAVGVAARPSAGWAAPEGAASEDEDEMDATWTPAAVERLVETLREAEVSSFLLEVAAVGLKLEATWGAASNGGSATSVPDEEALPASADRGSDDEQTVKAPVLGVFYRRPAPDQPIFVDEGGAVAAGQTIGLIEVMKTFHEVTAPRAGTLAAFLIEDGATVEYGQPLATLGP